MASPVFLELILRKILFATFFTTFATTRRVADLKTIIYCFESTYVHYTAVDLQQRSMQ